MVERIALIGYGAIGAAVHHLLQQHAAGDVEVVAILVRDPARVAAQAPEAAPLLLGQLDAVLARRPSLVVECAGHAAVDAHAAKVLQAGMDLMLVSVGALANLEREQVLLASARAAQRRLILPAGAIGGIDWLVAARSAGLHQVTYRSRKPPSAWLGSTAEQRLDLAALTTATPFFQGSAREAALQYPRNANVAATVALATLGFDQTQVEMVADPQVTANIHEVDAVSEGGRMTLRLEGVPDPHNPRSSVMTAHSVVRCIRNRNATLVM